MSIFEIRYLDAVDLAHEPELTQSRLKVLLFGTFADKVEPIGIALVDLF